MAAIVVVKAKNCTPVGYEVNDTCVLSEAVTAGNLLKFTGTLSNGVPVMGKAPIAGITEADGIAFQDGYAGQQGYSYGVQGEMDGFSGLTPGAPLYPSSAVAGGIDTTAIANATVRVKAIRAGRIRFNFV